MFIDWYFDFLKKIEDNEDKIIKDITFYHENYLKSKSSKSNYYSKYSPKNFQLILPNLVFNRVLKIEDEEEVKLKEYLKKMKDKNRNSVEHKTKKDLIIGEEFPINYNNNKKISTKDLNKFSNEFKIRVHSRINTFSKIKMRWRQSDGYCFPSRCGKSRAVPRGRG